MWNRLFVSMLLGVVFVVPHAQSTHLMRILTFCQSNLREGEYDMEFDGDELFYVDPYIFRPVQRLPEFAQQWGPDPGLPAEAYLAIGTCQYNIPRCVVGEQSPVEAIEPPSSQVYTQRELKQGVRNTLICFVTDFHPMPVNVSWTRNEEPVSELDISQTQYYSNRDYSFRVFSYLSFTPEDGDIYTCTVHHQGLQEPLTKIWELELQTDSQIMETAVCIIGVLLGLSGMAVGIFLIIKANQYN